MTDTNTTTQTPAPVSASVNVDSRQQEPGCARLVAVAPPGSCGSVHFETAAKAITSPPVRILRLPEVIMRVGLKRASIYQHIAAGSFPKQISLGIRAVGWLESEIDEWLSVRINARPAPKNRDAV